MDVALVEHAQHDVDGDDGGEDQQQLVVERRLEGQRGALECVMMLARQADLLLRRRDRVDRRAERGAGRRLNEIVVAGNWPRWLISSGAVLLLDVAIADSGTCRCAGDDGR